MCIEFACKRESISMCAFMVDSKSKAVGNREFDCWELGVFWGGCRRRTEPLFVPWGGCGTKHGGHKGD